jgi:DNA-binding response OmpR family regulator
MAKILIVEDDPRLELTYDTLFERSGHEVVRAHDGEEGLNQVKLEQPDIVLLDMLMPKMHGIEFLKNLDVRNSYPNMKIIVFSNMESADLTKEALELGASRYEVKSKFSPKELAKLVNEVLATRQQTEPS